MLIQLPSYVFCSFLLYHILDANRNALVRLMLQTAITIKHAVMLTRSSCMSLLLTAISLNVLYTNCNAPSFAFAYRAKRSQWDRAVAELLRGMGQVCACACAPVCSD